ncbi:MAG: FAD/NAD(P)-binding protein [Planctomycetia bacterium]|jgi:NAD(P)H-flavin reductase
MTAAPLAEMRDAWQHHATRIAAVRDEVAHVRTYDLAFRDPATAARFSFAPGQFNMLYLPGIGEAAISISSDPGARGSISHTVKAVGNVTDALARLTVGDDVILRGPFGTPWPLAELRGHDIVIAVGGVGLASVRAAILQIAHDRASYGHVAVLFGAKAPAAMLYEREYREWRDRGIDVHVIVDQADASWSGRTGLVTSLFDDVPLDGSRTGLICCGPEPMMLAVVRRAEAAGLWHSRMFVSMERNMICAARLCGLCQFGPEFVCRDGPVFPYDRIARFLAIPNL